MDGTERPLEERPLAALARLPRSFEPRRDLWPGIEARLAPREDVTAPRQRGWRLAAVAAGFAVTFLAGVLLGRQDGAPVPTPATGPALTLAEAAGPSVLATLRATEREYQAAWKGFEPVGVAPSVLGAGTVEDLERSWQAMKQAEIALTTALDEHPDNPYLAEKLLTLREQQLAFMRQLHMLDQNSRRNT